MFGEPNLSYLQCRSSVFQIQWKVTSAEGRQKSHEFSTWLFNLSINVIGIPDTICKEVSHDIVAYVTGGLYNKSASS